ncbi:tRNA (guanine(9)-N(1))-methyltransferase Trmt10A isoform X2 [Ptiloglossa arizonensis]|uniref:tRNA (guanine(9)-N(1))-methyltransferase Trmt10A isoform X2 n=1 Tax=Ptiloglossa arizonensis TaxID=3350558 RepID=UPI003FA104F8
MEDEKDTNNIEIPENGTRHTNICDQEICHNTNKNLSVLIPNMSKRQLKKVRRREKWLERKDMKRLKEREKARQKRAFARANNIDLGPSRKALKKSTMADSSCKILRCYTLNRRAIAPMQFSLTSFNGKSRTHMQKHNGYEHWDVKFHTESYLNIYPKDKIIYLTSESEDIIDHLEHDCVYVIGGLVDHNSHKGLCHKIALQAGVKHGQLPLDKFLQMKARKVLTVDHVFEILLRVSEGRTWQEAFLQVLPERKNAQPIGLLERNEDTANTCTKEETFFHMNNMVEINESENMGNICIYNKIVIDKK